LLVERAETTYPRPVIVLDVDDWTARAAAHEARLAPYVAPHLARREDGVKHPVHDFLFTYYAQRPAQLRRWHPGYGVALTDAPAYAGLRGYEVVSAGEVPDPRTHSQVAREYVASWRPLLESLHTLLTATASRPANFGCFGLHEWAMVHRADETRHPVPLRLGAAATDTVTESHRIACSHFDAFRFFTPTAVPLNTLSPSSTDRPAYEQPGCLHAGMDLYKHAFRLTPMISSDLVADCFELAWDIRILDMRAAPYDMTGTTLDPSGAAWTPVRIETPEGKQEYAAAQRRFAERGAPLRQRLIEECERLLSG
jgi:hypothetical protein